MNTTTLENEINQFQDNILFDMEFRKKIEFFNINNIENYPIFPRVLNPLKAKASLLFLKNLGVKKNDKVLDMFSGCGIDGIYSALNGAKLVDCIDNSTDSFNNINYAIKKFSLESKVNSYMGNLFDKIYTKKYDLILANPPFRGNKEPRTYSENALRDYKYNTLEKFWKNAGNHLNKNGRVRMVFSDVGDIEFNEKLMRENNFTYKIIAKTKYQTSVRILVYEARCVKK